MSKLKKFLEYTKDNYLLELGNIVIDLIENDMRFLIDESFIWGSFFEKENPKDINIVLKINTPIGQIDDKISILNTVIKNSEDKLDITIIDSNEEAFNITDSTKEIDNDKLNSYKNIDKENRIVKPLLTIKTK